MQSEIPSGKVIPITDAGFSQKRKFSDHKYRFLEAYASWASFFLSFLFLRPLVAVYQEN